MLLRERPTELQTLSVDVWREWAPAVVCWSTKFINGAKWEDKAELLSIAGEPATDAMRAALRRRVEAAIGAGRTPDLQHEAAHLWDLELVETYLGLLHSVDGEARRELAETLTVCDIALIREWLHAWIDDPAADQERYLLASGLLLDHDIIESWPRLEAAFDLDRSLALTALGASTTVRYRSGRDLPESLIAEIYLWLREAFPPEEDPHFDDAHGVGPCEAVALWRDQLLTDLRSRGTAQAVGALRAIEASVADAGGLPRLIAMAQAALRREQWQPTPLPELLRLATDSRTRLVHDLGSLVAVTTDALDTIQQRLTGATPESHLLWDTHAGRPKTEDEISDYLRNRLADLIGGHGVIVNREVQIRRSSSSGIGERTDLLVEAIDPVSPGALTLPVEVKGAWNAELLTGAPLPTR